MWLARGTDHRAWGQPLDLQPARVVRLSPAAQVIASTGTAEGVVEDGKDSLLSTRAPCDYATGPVHKELCALSASPLRTQWGQI